MIKKELNVLLANYVVMFSKLQHYHWNIEGDKFQPLHDLFKTEYDDFVLLMDEIAERLRTLNYKPLGSLKDYQSLSQITPPEYLNQKEMVKDVVQSYQIIQKQLKKVIKSAQKINDYVSEDLAIQNLNNFDKKIWMFSSFLKD